MFFQSFALFRCCLLSLLSAAVSSGEFFPLLRLLAWLAVAFFRSGLLCTAELRFSDRFPGPCSHIVGICSCKELILVFQFCAFFCLLPLFLVWFAVHRTFSVFTAKDMFKKIAILPKSVIILVVSEKELIVDLSGLRKKYLIRCQNSSSKIIFVLFHKK